MIVLDLKECDEFIIKLKVKSVHSGSFVGVYVAPVDALANSFWIPARCEIKEILPRPIKVGDTVKVVGYRNALFKVLFLTEIRALVQAQDTPNAEFLVLLEDTFKV